MPQPFSMLSPPLDHPTAIGESGWHLPIQPFLSGQDAVDSLVGYYPQKRMDSLLNPHTYRRPAGLRSTTLPHTKVAALLALAREKQAAVAIAGIDVSKSGLVAGFMEKCAAAGLTSGKTGQAIAAAIALHPAIAAEFQICGMTKSAIGSGGGFFGAKPNQPTESPGIATKLYNAAGGQSHQFTPQSVPKMMRPEYTTPSRNHPGRVPTPGSGAQRALTNTGNFLSGGLQWTAGNVGRAGLLPVRAIAWGRDKVKGNTEWGDGLGAVDQTFADAARSGNIGMHAGYYGHTPQSEAAIRASQETPHERNLRKERLPTSQIETTQAMRSRHEQELQDAYPEHGPALSGAYAGAHTFGEHAGLAALGGGLGRAVGAAPSTGAALATPPAYAAMDTALQAGEGTLRPNSASYYAGVAPDGAEMIGLKDGRVVPSHMINEQGLGPRDGAPGAQHASADASFVENTDIYPDIQTLVQSDPEQAQTLAVQAGEAFQTSMDTPEGQAEVQSATSNGTLTPAGEQKSLAALTSEGYDLDTAQSIHQNMSIWEKLGLWGGLGVAGIGLLNAMFGNGGLGSILMSLLGLGAAGFTAGQAGMLDQGAKDLTTGLQQMFSGGPQISDETRATVDKHRHMLHTIADPRTPENVKIPGVDKLRDIPILGNLTKNIPSEMGSLPALRQLAEQAPPEIVQQLDRMAGVGETSWGQNLINTFGAGQQQKIFQDLTGLNPEQQEQFINLWRKMRMEGTQPSE